VACRKNWGGDPPSFKSEEDRGYKNNLTNHSAKQSLLTLLTNALTAGVFASSGWSSVYT